MLRRKPTRISITQMDIKELDIIQKERKKSKNNKKNVTYTLYVFYFNYIDINIFIYNIELPKESS